jgi:hypothetical protein
LVLMELLSLSQIGRTGSERVILTENATTPSMHKYVP